MNKFFLTSLFSIFTITLLFAQELPTLVPYLKGGKFGFVDENKNIVIEPKFTNAYPFGYFYDNYYGPYYALVQIDSDIYFVDRKGNLAKEEEFKKNYIANYEFPPQQQELKSFKYFVFKKNEKKGLKDENNKIILKPVYEDLDIYSFSKSYNDKKNKKKSFKQTYANVLKDGKTQLIRIDKFKAYENVSLSSFRNNSNHMIVWIKNENEKFSNGILLNGELITISKKYTLISKFYAEQGIISVDKIIDNYPVTLYIDLKGNEYYEK